MFKNPHYFLYSLPMNKVRTKTLGTTEMLPLNKVRTKRLGTTEIVLFKCPWLPDYTHALPYFAHYKANCNTNTHCCYYNNLHLQLMHLHSQFTKFCHNTNHYLLQFVNLFLHVQTLLHSHIVSITTAERCCHLLRPSISFILRL